MITRNQLFTLMNEGATVITPNNRLSHQLLHDFFMTKDERVQAKPNCLPYAAFLQREFKRFCYQHPEKDHPLLLSGQQLRFLWRQVLQRQHNQLTNDGLLEAVCDAWSRCILWQIDFTHPSFGITPQTQKFQQWCLTLQEALSNRNALASDQIPDYLLQQGGPQHHTLIWACFDDYTPQQLALQNDYQVNQCQLFHYDLAESQPNVYSFAAKDDQEELQQLCYWLKDCLENKDQRIGVVIPNLQKTATKIRRFLKEELAEEQFNISLGKALSEYPLVAHALCWLQLERKKITLPEAHLLLHSPYLTHSQKEMHSRAQMMEHCDVLEEPLFALDRFSGALYKSCPQLADALDNLSLYPEKNSPNEWIQTFKARLIQLGFPGEYPLNSLTYQCYQRFLSLFDEFKQLTLIVNSLTKSEALALLLDLAKTTVFQPQQETVQIQILGLLEASGCSFDKLWISGLTDQCLPQATRPSPFIPLSLQNEKLMPHASAIREWELAEKAFTRFCASSPHVICSYPLLSEDKPNLASPLLAQIPPFPPFHHKEVSISWRENFVEPYQISFLPEEITSGGTALLANQAKCPFRAFALHRLNAESTPSSSVGPDAKERGKLIHRVMELLWQSLASQKNLLTLAKEELESLIEMAIQQALEPLILHRPESFSSLIQSVEKERLQRLVHAFLAWERERPPFTVRGLEQTFTINLAGLDFKVRLDRLDQVAEDKTWVIDYKTRIPATLPWNEERPKEPQLLLYALLDETINGLLYAELRAGQMSCKGLSESTATKIKGVNPLKKEETWARSRVLWKEQLQALAEEFSQGFCPPQPASPAVCQNCELQSLCRFGL